MIIVLKKRTMKCSNCDSEKTRSWIINCSNCNQEWKKKRNNVLECENHEEENKYYNGLKKLCKNCKNEGHILEYSNNTEVVLFEN